MRPEFKNNLKFVQTEDKSMYTRHLQTTLLQLSKTWPVITVTGPRQSGKTTLCKMAFPDYGYVNLEHIPTRDRIMSDIDGFLNQYPDGLIIDEIQNLPELFSFIQVRVDENKSLRYVLSGSSDFLLMQGISQSLAGRAAVKRLLPLSIGELGDISAFSTDELMVRGFFPAVWGEGRDSKEVYESYYETYLERDVRQIINIQNLSAFRHFIALCAGRVGSEFNATALSQEVGVSNQTITNWISILETSYTAFRLHPYYKNIGKRLSKMPKLYFYDVGLAAWILGIRNAQDLATHPLRGNLFENMIVVEMLKRQFNQGEINNLSFYRDKAKHEVDILQEYGSSIRGYEVKSGKTFHSDWLRDLKYLQGLMPEALDSTQVIYDGDEQQFSQYNGLHNYRSFFA